MIYEDLVQFNVISATIEDTGNLVLLNRTNQVVWQSFDSPSDTLLPSQRFSEQQRQGHNRMEKQ